MPGKNLRDLMGKPLIAYSIEQARATGLFSAVAVSSDSTEILDVARRFGADVLVERPMEMATDTAAKLPAIQHCVETAERDMRQQFSIFVDLDVTSPLRLPEDIKGAVRLLESGGASNVITGAPARRSPYFNLVELDGNGHVHLSKRTPHPITRRQDAPLCYDMNASMYVWRRDIFLGNPAVFYEDTLLFQMPEERSIDIDSELDWEIVELLMKKTSLLRASGDKHVS